jgi:cytidylate kinase
VSPLARAADAHELATDGLSIDEIVARIAARVAAVFL